MIDNIRTNIKYTKEEKEIKIKDKALAETTVTISSKEKLHLILGDPQED